MYLNSLKENEKKLFLGMAYDLAFVDGDYSKEEQAIMEAYSHEMQYEFDINTMVKSKDEIIDEIKSNSTIRTKRIFVFELIGLAMVDGNYDENERQLIQKMEVEFGLMKNFSKECEKVIAEYISFQERINSIVLG